MIALLRDGDSVMVDHELKTWPDAYQLVDEGLKVHEFRRNDRDFQIHETVLLREWEPMGEAYTDRATLVRITAISYGPEWGIPMGYAVFSFRRIPFSRLIEAS